MKAKTILKVLLIFLFFQFNNLTAQNTGQVIYNTILESEDFTEFESKLVFFESKSLFTFAYEIKESELKRESDYTITDNSNAELKFDIGPSLSSYRRVYIDKEKNEVISTGHYYKAGTSNKCTITESMGLFNWEITDKSKLIGTFEAFEAKTSFRGRNYTAWFTYEVPVDIGPWKFHGLPGLVLEVTDEEMGVQFYATQVEIPTSENISISKPNEGKHLSYADYAELRKNFSNEFIDLILSKIPRGVKYTYEVQETTSRSIERDY